MSSIFDGGPISETLSLIDPRYRAGLETAGVIFVAIWLVATTLNPILEFLLRIWRVILWIRRQFVRAWRRFFPQPPPPPEPQIQAAPIPEEKTIWESRAPTQPTFPKTNGIPIITVANMKGGVGKTTIVANLAPYFRKRFEKPVLLIDFDYQGSLTQTIRTEAGYTDPDLTAHILISPNYAGEKPLTYAREMRRSLEDIFIYTANYPFATIENNLLADWLQTPVSDLMYRLCALLQRQEFQSKFGAVLIDCPPRLTAGSINALCASTHLLVPSSLDEMSAQAAEYFLGQVSRMKSSVFPSLKVIGIVPSIIYRDNLSQLLPGEVRALDRLKKYGENYWKRDNFVLVEGRVPRKADVSNSSGLGVPYLRRLPIQLIFDRLGTEIEARL